MRRRIVDPSIPRAGSRARRAAPEGVAAAGAEHLEGLVLEIVARGAQEAVGDDGREADGAPESDGGSPTEEGRGVLRVHAAAFGRDGGRRAVEAELVRLCRPPEAGPPCLPGIRVQSWRDFRESLP